MKAYEGLPKYQLIEINLQRLYVALALMPPLEVHSAIEHENALFYCSNI